MKKTKLLVSVGALALICSVASCGHEHEFASEWSKDATNHWHAALCEHAEEVADLAAHTWNEGVVTLEPTDISDSIFTLLIPIFAKIRSISCGKSGVGFAPFPDDPINPVTHGVLRKKYQASSVIIISIKI